MIVADTNTIVYLLVVTERTSTAEAVYDRDLNWVAPRLWRHEFLNAVSLYVRQKLVTFDQAMKLVNRAEWLITTSNLDIDPRRVLELSVQSGCSTYDCEFVALAQRLDLLLVTSDAKVLKSFPKVAISMDAYLAQP